MNTPVDTRSLNLQLRPLVAAVLLMYSTGAYTAPEFANSPGNNVSVDQSKENLTVVTQTGERALANWRSFSVQEGEVVEFIQPGASSVILNRVVGDNPSEIFGKLLANGRVFLINPNGIVFGANSEVNVGGLVATTLSLKEGNRADADSFQLEEGKDAGSIVLNGAITAGQLALIAPRIQNRGVVTATGNTPLIQLIAAEKVSANTTGSDLVFKVEAGHENAVIEQLGGLFAEGGRIVLIAKSSADGQPSVINTAQLNKASRILIQGDTVRLGGQFDTGGATGVLDVQAKLLGQSEAVFVTGQASLKADTVNLSQAQNDFAGAVSLNASGQVKLQDANQLVVQGRAGHLNATAENISQTAALQVDGSLVLNAVNVQSDHADNQFQGNVKLDVSQNAALQGKGVLTVEGVAGNASLQAEELVLKALETRGNLQLNAASIRQSEALLVQGNTVIESSGSVLLDHSANDFQGELVLAGSANVALRDVNNLDASGSVNSLILHAANPDSGTVSLGDLNARQLSVTARTVKNREDTAVTVSGQTQLSAAHLDLNSAGNDFVGLMQLDVTQGAVLRDANKLTVGGSTKNALLKAGAIVIGQSLDVGGNLEMAASDISQQAGLTVAGSTTLDGTAAATLNHSGNDFGGAVKLKNKANANLRDRNNLQVGGSAGYLAVNAPAVATGRVLVDELLADSLTITGQQVSQAGAIHVSGDTRLSAAQVDLNSSSNAFGGEVRLAVSGHSDLQASGNLRLGGAINSAQITAGRLAFNGLTAQGDVVVSADTISQASGQAGALVVNGKTTLRGGNAALSHSGNSFRQAVAIELAEDAILHSSENLELSGKAGQVQATAANRLTVSSLISENISLEAGLVQLNDFKAQGNLTLGGGTVEQNGALVVEGETRLRAANHELQHAQNDFKGQVRLDVSGRTVLHDQNILNVSGLIKGPAQLVAQQVQQDSQSADSLHTQGALLVQAGVVQLANSHNQLDGGVRIEGATRVDMVSQKKLSVEGSKLGKLSLSASTLELKELGQLQELSLRASGISQTAALQVQGTTRIHADQVTLDNMQNDFGAEVRVAALQQQDAMVEIADRNSLNLHAGNMLLTARVEGDLDVQADNLVLNTTTAKGNTALEAKGLLSQKAAVNLNNASLKAARFELNKADNHFGGTTRVSSNQEIRIRSAGDLVLDTASSTGALALQVNGHTHVQGEQVQFEDSLIQKSLTVSAGQISQQGALLVQGDVQLFASGGTVDLSNSSNQFHGKLSAVAAQTRIAAQGDLNVLDLQSGGGTLHAEGRLVLHGRIEQTGGSLDFVAKGSAKPLSAAEIALLLPSTLDVFSGKQAVDPVTGLGRITLASPVIEQVSGEIITRAGSQTRFDAPGNGSIILTGNNQIGGEFNALAGAAYGQGFDYKPDHGSSLLAVNNGAKLQIGGKGVDADLVAIRSRGLSTPGDKALIRARMPYNDVAAGTSRSFAGLTLSLPTGANDFGEPALGAPIRVEVGDSSRPGLGGYMTVIPFEAGVLNPGQAIHLAGLEGKGSPTFFYDGARSLNRVPVVYNGSLLLSPQESAALTSAQGAVALARLEQTRSVVRTENLAGKVIHGVVAEVGPGRPATEGEGAARKPSVCEAPVDGLGCKP